MTASSTQREMQILEGWRLSSHACNAVQPLLVAVKNNDLNPQNLRNQAFLDEQMRKRDKVPNHD
ncbi:hypothetical protein KIN20_013784 [Parelaphostrongylus tenuis]|uniref:Uncharacterized protein n=1 Tax=Parelaphostrongylus tenuis TaxID=148309 RepID=A0AAD5MY09_PARTN|nr:hypothetical protein KIN20_013784 [Parelaphostrongylus tenuis]